MVSPRFSRRLRLARLALRSLGAPPGPRRAGHPFVAGLRPGQVIPHQGGHWADADPNTMAAFERAARRSQILDVDLWLTADEILVCSHDDEVGDRRISTSTWGELAATTSVPRFADVAAAFPEHRMNVEIKDARAVDAIRLAMQDEQLADRSCLSTFGPLLARALAGAVPRAAHARPTARASGRLWGRGDVVQTMTFVPDAGAAFGAAKPLVLRAAFGAGSPELVARQLRVARKKGYPLFAWTVNDEVQLRALVDAGVDAVLSDRPELFDDDPSPG